MREPSRPLERGDGALETALPAVCARQRLGGRRIGGSDRAEGTQAFPFARRGLERPGQRGEGPAPRPALELVGLEERASLLPERARLARRAVVGRGLADEVEAARGPGARGVEEVAVARDRVGAEEPSGAGRELELGL